MVTRMTAVGSFKALPVEDPQSLVDVEVDVPLPDPTDVIVEVEAVSVNPHDVQTRAGLPESSTPRILGYDAVGHVSRAGEEQSRFALGDRVLFSGDMRRQGANARYARVDARLAGRAPDGVDAGDLAALPLTAITAWECLFDRLRLDENSDGPLLVVGGAGGVPSILIQLAKALTRVTVIATAGRKASVDWVWSMGADHVVDHRSDLTPQVEPFAPEGLPYIVTSHTKGALASFGQMIAPFGQIVALDGISGDADDFDALQWKSVTWHFELMFSRSIFGYDMSYQGDLLTRVGELLADGTLRTTRTTTLHGITAASVREAHRLVESGTTVGKVVVVAA